MMNFSKAGYYLLPEITDNQNRMTLLKKECLLSLLHSFKMVLTIFTEHDIVYFVEYIKNKGK